jgi:hypothetical protein
VPACDDEIQSGDETDIDCGGSCEANCEFGEGCVEADDCETLACDDTCLYPLDCADLLDKNPGLDDGEYMIDPDGDGGVDPFIVSCDMSTDGGGWFRFELSQSDNMIINSHRPSNPWTKCDDDSAKHMDWTDEDTAVPDFEEAQDNIQDVALKYANPDSNTLFTSPQMAAIRDRISEMNTSTRMVAVSIDDEAGDWENNMGDTGQEVYITGSDDTEFLLTPGENGDCADGVNFPVPGQDAAHWIWHHTAQHSIVDGDVSIDSSDLNGLPQTHLLPKSAKMVTYSGGGTVFGWEKQIFLVR